MGKPRPERRLAKGTLFNVYSDDTTAGWRVIGHARGEIASIQVARRRWRKVFYEGGALAGYQVVAPRKAGSAKAVGKLEGTPATITFAETEMNAGLRGRSRTAGMPEWKRAKRHAKFDEKKILPPEDAVELAQAKVRLWPYPASRVGTDDKGAPVYGDRAVRVYPRADARSS